jgi:uncharacterized protein (UPF0332 family)
MSFDWTLYIEIARKLIAVKANGLDEARFRTAIGRSYYGVFCIAREFVESSKPTPLDPKFIHWQVINALEGSDHPLQRKIGANLKRLKRQREDCDYKKDCTVREQDAEQAYTVATRVLENLEKAGAV